MSKRILNLNNCTFMCPALQGEILKKQSNHKFNDGNGIALTKETTLTGAGICAILTAQAEGTPMSCILKNSKNWISGFEIQKKINGIPILNEDAEMPCNVGSVIKVKKPLLPIIPVIPELPAISSSSDNLSSSENPVSDSACNN